MRRLVYIGTGMLVAMAVAVAVWRQQAPNPGPAQPEDPGSDVHRPVPVVTAKVDRKDVPVYLDGLGTVQGYNTVTVHTRVDGELTRIAFTEGQEVHAGDVLARIDARTYQAQLDQAAATKARDEAQLDLARLDLQRYLGLGNRINGQTVDTARALVKQLEAAVKVDQAAVDTARTMLSYTTITSPISGRTGLRQVDPGNIVRATDSTGLVVVTQMQPIAVVFTLPQQNLPAINEQLDVQSTLPVEVIDADRGTGLDRGGLALVDNQIDQNSGTIRLKAVCPNARRRLWPGEFVTARLLLTTRRDGLVVPATAIQHGPQGAYVFRVEPGTDTVAMRPVVVALIVNDEALIDSGLAAGETVVTDGMAKLQNGSPVLVMAAREGTPPGTPDTGSAGATGTAP
jgi:multidrug efflux system membrane fusion protein